MSFARETRNELSRVQPEKKCCVLAEIAGFLRVCGSVVLLGKGRFRIIASTDSPAVARNMKKSIQDYFSVETSLEITQEKNLARRKVYALTIEPDQRSEAILRETGMLMVKEGHNYLSDGIYEQLTRTKCCRKAMLRGLFMGAGSLNNPEKEHHFEIVCNTLELANDVKKLMNSFHDIFAKIVDRKGEFVVYVKEAEQIVDLMAIMGATNHLFQYEDIRIKKDIRNQTNRIINCDQANIDKVLAASERQLDSIRRLMETGEMDYLPEKLQEVAKLRLENPELPLGELGRMMQTPVGKSTVYKRLAKIEQIAKERN